MHLKEKAYIYSVFYVYNQIVDNHMLKGHFIIHLFIRYSMVSLIYTLSVS